MNILKNFKFRIYLIVLGAAFLLFCVGAYIIYGAYLNTTEKVLVSRKYVALMGAASVEEKLSCMADHIDDFLENPTFRTLVEKNKWEEALALTVQFIRSREFPIERFSFFDANGILRSDYPLIREELGQDRSFRDWYKGAISTQKTYISEVYKRAAAPQVNIVAIAVPIKDKLQNIISILRGQIRLETLLNWVESVDVGEGGSMTVVDQYGHIIAGSGIDLQKEITKYPRTDILEKISDGQSGSEIILNEKTGEEEIVSYALIPGFEWGIIAEQPKSVALKVGIGIMTMVEVWASFILIVSFLIYLLLINFNKIKTQYDRERIFLNSISDGVIAIDRAWNIILWNNSASSITGWAEEEALGKPLREIIKFIREYDRKENIAFIEQAILFGKSGSIENNTILIKKDGKEIPIGDSAAPIFDQEKRITGAIIVIRDILKEREMQMIRSDFAYASHQLRTPVGKALWQLETALKEKDFGEIKEKIRIADISLKSTEKIVERLLEIVEIDQRIVIPKIEPIKLIDALESVIMLVNKEAGEKNVAISVSPVPAFASINTDQKLIKRIFDEILDNAIQYSPPKSEIKIMIFMQKNEILIEIQDFGIGIIAKEQPLIFTKYFRGSNVHPESIGAGLGLFISREYIKLLGGKIWFKSEENKGTTFSILLPMNS